MEDKPIALNAWEELAEAYSSRIQTKAHNALYERPATLSLLPGVVGKRMLDAGCGPGVYAKLLIEAGAEVVGIDASSRMVELAKGRVGARVQIYQADLQRPLNFLEDESFDIVLSCLALDYVREWGPVFREFYRVLRDPGTLVFSVGHPFDDFYRFQETANYFEIEPVQETWRGFGFEIAVPFYRRPLAAMLNPAIGAGFALDRILEPRPVPEFEDVEPEDYEKLMKQPGFMCVRARKGGST